MSCDDCKYFVLHKGNFGHKEGNCHRYPEPVQKLRTEFCGEHKAKPKKKA